jgi:hypothetical protein
MPLRGVVLNPLELGDAGVEVREDGIGEELSRLRGADLAHRRGHLLCVEGL